MDYQNSHIVNLRKYFGYTSKIGGWDTHNIGKNLIAFNGTKDSLFNFVFCHNDVNEDDVKSILQYLTKKECSATWAVDPSMVTLISLMKKYNIRSASKPKKAFLNLNNYYTPEINKDIEFIQVDNHEKLMLLDEFTSEIFYHDRNIVSKFLKGLADQNIKQDNLKFFLVQYNNDYAGVCGFHLEDGLAGFYADGVFKKYRGRGIGSQMIAYRIKMLKQMNCEEVIAHCMSASVNVYKRQGFRMLGGLNLYVSDPDEKQFG